MANESLATRADRLPPNIEAELHNVWIEIDAALPTLSSTVEELGNGDAARSYWLAERAVARAHEELGKILGIRVED